MEIDDITLSDNKQRPDGAFLCKDDTMEPLIKNGDYVLVKQNASLNVGDFAIFYFDGRFHLRQYLNRNNKPVIRSLNANTPETPYLPIKHRCVGVVTGVIR